MEVSLADVKQELLECSYCEQRFFNNASLKNHLKSHFKKETDGELCEKCSKEFRSTYHLNKHVQKCNNKYSKRKGFVCGVCGLETVFLENHFETQHNIVVEKEYHEFSDKESFSKWKDNIEKTTVARFVKHRGTVVDKQGVRRTYFNCHRGGFFIKRGKNKRHFKAHGSNKINGHCPAAIVLREDENKIEATYIKTHVGHEHEYERIPLSKADKDKIARKLVNNLSVNEILTEVKDSVSDGSVSRLHFINRKDISNILARHELCKKLSEEHNNEVNQTGAEGQLYQPSTSRGSYVDHVEYMDDDCSYEVGGNEEEPLEVVLLETNSVNAESLDELNLLVSKQFGRNVRLTLPNKDKRDELNLVCQERSGNEVDHCSGVIELVDRSESELLECSGNIKSEDNIEIKEEIDVSTQAKSDAGYVLRGPEEQESNLLPGGVVYVEYKLSQERLKLAETQSLESLRAKATEQFQNLIQTADSKEKLLFVLDQISELNSLISHVISV